MLCKCVRQAEGAISQMGSATFRLFYKNYRLEVIKISSIICITVFTLMYAILKPRNLIKFGQYKLYLIKREFPIVKD